MRERETKNMALRNYETGEIWWVHIPFEDVSKEKRRPAIVLEGNALAVYTAYVTSKNKDNPYTIEIEDWEEAGLKVKSWIRIDRIVSVREMDFDSKIGCLSARDRDKTLQLAMEYMSGASHEFSIIAIKNSKDQYLQKYDTGWNCWLFPYVRSSENNKSNVDKFVSGLFNRELVTRYVAHTKHCKYSVSDNVYKIYNHKLYEVTFSTADEKILPVSDDKYCWMTFEDMLSDKATAEYNDDVIAFVKANIT